MSVFILVYIVLPSQGTFFFWDTAAEAILDKKKFKEQKKENGQDESISKQKKKLFVSFP